ncbi:rhamnan synthesis F family protein [Fulvimarina endophytica]|nr:rhamnan synthesis F family protein [Fulvimarina endophytica]
MKPVAVFVHIHYVEAWPALRERIERSIQLPFRIVATGAAAGTVAPPDSPHLCGWQTVETANRGRDVLPFIEALRQAGDFDIGLKLHGKRSVHRLDGEAWAEMLTGELLPSPAEVAALVARFEGDERIGLAGAPTSFCTTAFHIGHNEAAIETVARRLDRDPADLMARTPFFCAGTMFWFRRTAFASLASTDLADLFEPEAGQTDGTAAHALERLFPALCEDAGYLALPIDLALSSDPSTSDSDLARATREQLDTDNAFVRRPGMLAAIVLSRLPHLARVYQALPQPVRRVIRWGTARGGTGSGR